jgi:hypothetical protein
MLGFEPELPKLQKLKDFPMTAVRALLHSHPEQISQADAISRCIDACFACVEMCTACADACLAEKHIDRLINCIRLNLDCASVCTATGHIVTRANKAGHRQLQEAQLTTCIAFCRACASECSRHAAMHQHCAVCAEACNKCAAACADLLASMRMPA